MNYFEHHIGDYDKNTSHLTACEDGIYHRMIRRYYDKERPLDADVVEVKRLVRARTRDEKAAVDSVLREFFHLEADGWHHDKCDEVLADFLAGEPEREAKRKNEDARLAKHRIERSELFAVINAAGEHLAWNTPISDLRAAAKRIRSGTATPTATQPATAPATPATATQSPIPTSHTPELNPPVPPAPAATADPPPPLTGVAEPPGTEGFTPTPAGAICRALKLAGIARVNPSHPTLLALIAAGATADELTALAPQAATKGEPFAYLLDVAVKNRQRAADQSATMAKGSIAPPDPNAWRRDERGIRAMQAQLGVDGPRSGESMTAFEARVLRAWQRAGEPAPKPLETA